MHPIIALWSHPRSMSTAFERIMRERGDCTCVHEPFIYDYYVHRKVRNLPHFDIDPTLPVSYDEIRDSLLEAAETGPVFFKDMSYYVLPALFDDRAFAERVVHSFLIRTPMKSILSFYKLDADLTSEEIGIEAQWRHVEWLEKTFGTKPAILKSEDVQRDPQAALRTYWQAVGLSFAPQAFQWQGEDTPEGWGQVAGWHGSVLGSNTIEAPSAEADAARQAAFDAVARETPKLQDYLDHHRPFYEHLAERALPIP